jgi:hypothetical protein
MKGMRQLETLRHRWEGNIKMDFNPLNAKLNPICHLLALLGARHILHFSRIRVKKSIDWNHLALHRGRGLAFVNMAVGFFYFN